MQTRNLRLVQLSFNDTKALGEGKGIALFEQREALVHGSNLDDDFSISHNKQYYEALIKDPKNEKWYLQWQIIHKEDNKLIGGISFKGGPNEKGEVEIGYGLDETYRNRGYMTEAIIGLLPWALVQPMVTAVIAETDKNNKASQKVVEKVGMQFYYETEKEIWWIIRKDNTG